MKIFAAFPSRYLKAADLHDKHVKTTMSHVMLEEIANKDGAEMLPILYFNGVPKGMVLNKTNAKAISSIYTDETDAWRGMPIVLFPAMVAFGAETVEAIRVKASGYSSGGPSAAERIKAINESPHKEVLGEHMIEQTVNRESRTRDASPLTEGWEERARQVWATKKPTPRPKVSPISDVMHDADGVVWDETAERAPTAEEHAEVLRESMQRANADLDERRAARGATQPDDLELPGGLRVKPVLAAFDPSYNWIEHIQEAAE
jgi:hypothetical protein